MVVTMFHSQATDTVPIIMEKPVVEPRTNIFGFIMTSDLQVTVIGITGMQETIMILLFLSVQSRGIELILLSFLCLPLSNGFNSITIITIKTNVVAILVAMVVATIMVVAMQTVAGGILIMEPFC